jgi:hypothetical protein
VGARATRQSILGDPFDAAMRAFLFFLYAGDAYP